MHTLLRKTLQGAAQGAQRAFFEAAPTRWLEVIVQFDASVTSSYAERSWWRPRVHAMVPLSIFTVALLRLIERQNFVTNTKQRSQYGMAGSGKHAGIVCIDEKMGKVCGEVSITRMVRTADGRVVRQQDLLKEQKDVGQAPA